MIKQRARRTKLGRYLIGVVVTLMVADGVWQYYVNDVWYHCTDSLPWELFNFGPTFAHTSISRYGSTGDWRLASEFQLRLLQGAFFAAALIIPALTLWLTGKLGRCHQAEPEPA